MIKLLSVIVLITSIACDRKPGISGHWVSVPDGTTYTDYDNEDEKWVISRHHYWTIDIIDSLLIMDRGSLTQNYGVDTVIVREIYLDSLPHFEGKEQFSNLFDAYSPGYAPIWNYKKLCAIYDSILYNYGDEIYGDELTGADPMIASIPPEVPRFIYDCITLRNDTLIAYGEHMFRAQFFVRRPPDFRSDLFADLNVDIELPEYEGRNCKTRSDLEWPVWISVGKSNWINVEKSSIQADTFKIQVGDIYIDLTGIRQFFEIERFRLELQDKEKFTIALAIDRNSPKTLIDDVVKYIRDYDERIEMTFAVINSREEKVCLIDSVTFFPLFHESGRNYLW